MHTFYLIRHGQKYLSAGDPELTELGHQQAAATAEFMAQFPVQNIFASPSLRTQQTAAYFSQALKLPVQINALLRERANWGDDPNQNFEQFLDMWAKTTQDRNFIPKIGDSSVEAGERLEQIVELIRKDSGDDRHVILVSHGGVIGDFLRNIFGDEKLAEMLKVLEYRQPGDYKIKECSITQIEFDHQTPVLKKLASVEHLIAKKLTQL